MMRRNQAGLQAANIALSTGIVAAFIFLLVLAMAQDQALTGLSKERSFRNYSSSYIEARKADDAAELLTKLQHRRAELQAMEEKYEVEAVVLGRQYSRELISLAPMVSALKTVCPSTPTQQVFPTEKMSPSDRQMMETEMEISSIKACVRFKQDLDPGIRQEYLQTSERADKNSDRSVEVQRLLAGVGKRLETLAGEERRLQGTVTGFEGTRAHFRLLDALEMPWWVPLDFVKLPPFIIHVLLSFFSGMFGALLITMVFVVYPSKLRERVSTKLYYKRIFLGGLVAVTVFIVVAGGASILGGTDSGQVGTNFMSFAAIGLLAGMFSDLVADWLSDRAKTMFSSDREHDEPSRGGDEAGRKTDAAEPG